MFAAFVFFFFFLIFSAAALVFAAVRYPDVAAPIFARVRAIAAGYPIRVLLAGGLSLLLLIPLAMIDDLVDERESYRNEAVRSVVRDWGTDQVLTGPVLVIPYEVDKQREVSYVDDDGKKRLKTVVSTFEHTVTVLPQTLNVVGHLVPEIRKRGIYQSNVYTAEFMIDGDFAAVDMAALDPKPTRVNWRNARISVGVEDPRGIAADITLSVGAKRTGLALLAGTGAGLPMKGFSAQFPQSEVTALQAEGSVFSVDFSVRGSDMLNFVPVGETTDVALSSTWPSPSFYGAMLPTHRETSGEGFEASWKVPHVARNYPQVLVNADSSNWNEMLLSASGVRLIEPVRLYSKTERAVKYGFLFIGLSFLTLLMIEFALKIRLHLVQYGVIGGALTLVYLLILSLAEHLGFALAYIAATATMVLLVAGYAHLSRGAWRLTAWIAGVLTALYGVLYCLLNLEDYALLVGTGLLLAVLIVVMAMTRNLITVGPGQNDPLAPTSDPETDVSRQASTQ